MTPKNDRVRKKKKMRRIPDDGKKSRTPKKK